jgi:L-asparaginase
VLVVLNDEIHAAQFVRKTHTCSPSTFSSAPLGPIGWLAEDEPRILMCPPIWPTLKLDDAITEAPVALIKMGLGDDGRLIDAVVKAGYHGLIFEAFGGGHCPPIVADALQDVSAEIPVILCSRTGSGEVLQRTYGFIGAEIDLLSRGLIRAGWLDGPKARILLALLLRAGAPSNTIKEMFASAVHGFKDTYNKAN